MNIINLEERRLNKLRDRFKNRIRKMDDYYDYSVIPDYELELDFDTIDRLPISCIVAQVAKVGDEHVLVSLAQGVEYGVEWLLSWLNAYQVAFFPCAQESYQIKNASRIFDALYFEGCALIYSRKGHTTLTVNHSELEDVFEYNPTKENILDLDSYSEVDWEEMVYEPE